MKAAQGNDSSWIQTFFLIQPWWTPPSLNCFALAESSSQSSQGNGSWGNHHTQGALKSFLSNIRPKCFRESHGSKPGNPGSNIKSKERIKVPDGRDGAESQSQMNTQLECYQMDVNKIALAQLPSKKGKINMDTSALLIGTTAIYTKGIITAEPCSMRCSI